MLVSTLTSVDITICRLISLLLDRRWGLIVNGALSFYVTFSWLLILGCLNNCLCIVMSSCPWSYISWIDTMLPRITMKCTQISKRFWRMSFNTPKSVLTLFNKDHAMKVISETESVPWGIQIIPHPLCSLFDTNSCTWRLIKLCMSYFSSR